MSLRQQAPSGQRARPAQESSLSQNTPADDPLEVVHLTLRVHTVDALKVRKALHDALGDRIGVYVVSVDHVHHRTTLQLQTCRSSVDAIMQAIMMDLLQAEFGPVTRSSVVH
jgi:hypothetical protein